MNKLTGKTLHHIMDVFDPFAFAWKDLSKNTKLKYEHLAVKITDYIEGNYSNKEIFKDLKKSNNERKKVFG